MKTVSPLRSSKRNGFTLFEVTVAIPVLLSLTTLTILGVRDYLKAPPPIVRSDSSEVKASLIEHGLLTPVRSSRPPGAPASTSRKAEPLVTPIPELRPPATVVSERAGAVTESKRK